LHWSIESLFKIPRRPFHAGAALNDDAAIADFIRKRARLCINSTSTCRMGKKEGVVDHELKVHGIANLRVVDASVMPKIVSGNTQAQPL
jgi:choline dehydrogenase-like flavoprotein